MSWSELLYLLDEELQFMNNAIDEFLEDMNLTTTNSPQKKLTMTFNNDNSCECEYQYELQKYHCCYSVVMDSSNG